RMRADRILRRIDPLWANLQLVASPSLDERRQALENLLGYRDARLVEPLLPRLKDESESDCLRNILHILTLQRDRRATQPLLAFFKALPVQAAGFEELTLHALAEIGDPAAFEPLRDYR